MPPARPITPEPMVETAGQQRRIAPPDEMESLRVLFSGDWVRMPDDRPLMSRAFLYEGTPRFNAQFDIPLRLLYNCALLKMVYCTDQAVTTNFYNEHVKPLKWERWTPGQGAPAAHYVEFERFHMLNFQGTAKLEQVVNFVADRSELDNVQDFLIGGLRTWKPFATYANLWANYLKNKLEVLDKKDLVISGHSLGAAVAGIIGTWLTIVSDKIRPIATTLVGCPKFSEEKDLDTHTRKHRNLIHYAHHADPVLEMPLQYPNVPTLPDTIGNAPANVAFLTAVKPFVAGTLSRPGRMYRHGFDIRPRDRVTSERDPDIGDNAYIGNDKFIFYNQGIVNAPGRITRCMDRYHTINSMIDFIWSRCNEEREISAAWRHFWIASRTAVADDVIWS